MKKFDQPFHLVTFSPWPLLMSMSMFIFFVGAMNFLNNYYLELMIMGQVLMILCLFQWWRDVVRESSFQGFHTMKVVEGLKIGMILFIISEIFFFLSIFWCYFHMFLSPAIEIGMNWPPKNINIFDPYKVPLLNTMILLSSGVTVTASHYSLIMGNWTFSKSYLFLTLILGAIFSLLQYIEYLEASFSISDSVFGAIFFMSTGFHGLHVLVGTIFLSVCLFRMLNNEFSKFHHFGYEAAIWYWHFVDVVWLFLYIFVYYWIF